MSRSKRISFAAFPESLEDLETLRQGWARMGYPEVTRGDLIRYALNWVAGDFLLNYPDLRRPKKPDLNQLPLFPEEKDP